MAYPSCDLFKKLLSEGKGVVDALSQALKVYQQGDIGSGLKSDIEWYLLDLSSADFDGNFRQVNHQGPVPEELRELLRISIIELIKLRTPSTLVADIETEVAAGDHHLKVLYEQAILIEKAFKKPMPTRHAYEAKDKFKELTGEIRQKFAQLILQSQTEEALEAALEDAFREDSKETPLVDNLKVELQSQHEFLANKGFFKEFYALEGLAKQFDYAFDFHLSLKTTGQRTPEIRETFIHLHYACIDSGYQPVETKKHELARLRETVQGVFTKLKPFAQTTWKPYEEDDLYEELCSKLAEDKESYLKWSQIRKALSKNPIQEDEDFFSHAHCIKYLTQDPGMPPDDVARAYGLTLTPIKKKQRTSEATRQGPPLSAKTLFSASEPKKDAQLHPTDQKVTQSLLCTDETLDEEPKESVRKNNGI